MLSHALNPIFSRLRGSVLGVLVGLCAIAPVCAQDGVTRASITLGQSTALSGPAAALALPFAQGARLYFDRLNAAGGVNGREIKLQSADDAGNPVATLANTKKLLAQGVLALFGYYGSPQVAAVNALLGEEGVLLFAPMAAADELRGSLYPNVYSLRPGYSEEAAAITRHAQTLGLRRLAIVHGADAESLAALEAAERTMTSLGANLIAKATADSVAKALVGAPESVLVIGDFRAAAPAIKELRAKGYRGPIYAFSNAGESLLADQLGAAGAGVVVARVTPKSDHAKSPLVRNLAADAAAAKLGKPNVYMLEGYIAAHAIAEALKKAGKEPTRARLRKAIEGLSELDMGGFRVHFSGERVGSKLVELSFIDSQGRVRD
jgi:ABC-type branched-subunit amino acid transport system substrate-binding protein